MYVNPCSRVRFRMDGNGRFEVEFEVELSSFSILTLISPTVYSSDMWGGCFGDSHGLGSLCRNDTKSDRAAVESWSGMVIGTI